MAQGALSDNYEYYRKRQALPANDPRQGMLAPLEHQQVAREATERSPLAAGWLTLATPGWAAFKSALNYPFPRGVNVPYDNSSWNYNTQPSMEQVGRGYQGMWEGLGVYQGMSDDVRNLLARLGIQK